MAQQGVFGHAERPGSGIHRALSHAVRRFPGHPARGLDPGFGKATGITVHCAWERACARSRPRPLPPIYPPPGRTPRTGARFPRAPAILPTHVHPMHPLSYGLSAPGGIAGAGAWAISLRALRRRVRRPGTTHRAPARCTLPGVARRGGQPDSGGPEHSGDAPGTTSAGAVRHRSRDWACQRQRARTRRAAFAGRMAGCTRPRRSRLGRPQPRLGVVRATRPSAAHRRRQPSRSGGRNPSNGGWWLGSMLLALVLTGQIAYAEREQL